MDDMLRISGEFALPLDAVTETFAILGTKGSGKTTTAVVMAEEMIRAGLPVVVIDPLGVWWGLRSTASGDGDGLPVVIFGGKHADLPLGEKSGGRLADLIVERRPPAVLDVSGMSKTASRRFVADFLERMFLRNEEPLHLILDEADRWSPQRPSPEGARCFGAVDDVVRLGRVRGLGSSLITQRPAVLHKDVMSQASVLMTLRMAGVHDVAAIDDWVRLHATEDQAKTVKGSLPSLPVGTTWVWSPGWLGLLQQVAVRGRTTFDSSATPKVGQRRIMPERLAPVDLAALRDLLEADDPDDAAGDAAGLRRQVAELRRQLANRPAPKPVEVEVPVEVSVEVSVLTDEDRELLRSVAAQLSEIEVQVAEVLARAPKTPAAAQQQPTVRPPKPVPDPASTNGQMPPLKAGARTMLDVLAQHHPLRLTRAQLATLAGLKVTGGTFGTYYGVLRREGLIEERDKLTALSVAGVDATDVSDREPATTEEVLGRWRAALKAGARTMLDRLVDAHPRWCTRQELASAADLEVSGGTFGTYLGTLRRNGLVDVDGDPVRASDTLFLRDRAAT